MTITLKIGLFLLTCVLYILTNRLMRVLMPDWPVGGQMIAMGLGALVASLWIHHLGLPRKRWILTWSTVVPVGLVLAWFFHEVTMKFTVQWFLTLGLGILTIALLVQNAYTPGSTVVATAMVFAFAPMIAFGVLRSLWDARQETYTIITFFCLIVMLTVANGLG